MHPRLLLPIYFIILVLSGCDQNVSGKVEAGRFGDRSDIPAPRARYDALMTESCGSGAANAQGELLRTPYVQKLTRDSGSILWTARPNQAFTVDVALPGGASVASFDAQIDASAPLRDASQYEAKLSGLQPGQLYCYSVRGPDGMVMPATGLRTAPEPGSGAPVSFVAFGDSGYGGADQDAVFEQIQSMPFDLVLVTGDVAYPEGTLQQYEDNYFAVYQPMLASFPVFPTSGNHDYKTKKAEPFREVFALPENGAPEGVERWYSFDWGDVHFVALDTERIGDAQANWLDADLAENELPWTVVIAHKSPYSSGSHGSERAFRAQLSPILEFHGVQLVLAGHDHNYERTHPIEGVTYVVTGGGGRGTRGVGSSSFTAFSHDVLHFVYVRIEGDELRLYAIDATGQEFDFAHIMREP